MRLKDAQSYKNKLSHAMSCIHFDEAQIILTSISEDKSLLKLNENSTLTEK